MQMHTTFFQDDNSKEVRTLKFLCYNCGQGEIWEYNQRQNLEVREHKLDFL